MMFPSSILKSLLIAFSILGQSANVSGVTPNSAVKCNPSANTVYSYTETSDGTPVLRGYPSQAIADSCNPDWRSFEVIDCTGIAIGATVELCAATPGSSVSCNPNDPPTVYEYILKDDGIPMLQGYPNPRIANSCSQDDWRNPTAIDCTGIAVGPVAEFCGGPCTVVGEQNCVVGYPTIFEVCDTTNIVVEMDTSLGTKCCKHPAADDKIIQQFLAFDCP